MKLRYHNSLNNFAEVNDNNMDLILADVKEFLYLYLFKGSVSDDINLHIEDLFNLKHDDLLTLKTAHFLLSDEVRNLIVILPQLIRNLVHSTKKETTIINGNVRGKINWSQTIKERLSRGFDDKALFVCQPSLKYYDLEENQLLKFLLKKIIFLKDNYLDFVSLSNFNIEDIDSANDWYEIVSNNYKMSVKILNKVYFDEIETIEHIKSKHIRKCYKNRNTFYHIIANAYQLYERLFIENDLNTLKELIETRLIKVVNPDKLYEIYIFFNLFKDLKDVNYRVLHSKGDYSTNFIIDNVKVTIHYQFTPNTLNNVSEYKKILKNYEITAHTRSPDIIIEFEKECKSYYRIIEVKNSSKTSYIRNSLYKVMGYYKDFEGIKNTDNFGFVENFPIVLVTWGGINIKENYDPFEDKIIILNRNEFLDNVEKLIKCN